MLFVFFNLNCCAALQLLVLVQVNWPYLHFGPHHTSHAFVLPIVAFFSSSLKYFLKAHTYGHTIGLSNFIYFLWLTFCVDGVFVSTGTQCPGEQYLLPFPLLLPCTKEEEEQSSFFSTHTHTARFQFLKPEDTKRWWQELPYLSTYS
jgi:hypothetical protein